MATRITAEMREEDRYLRELHRGLASVNFRKVHDIREAVSGLVNAVGGAEAVREHFRTRRELESALADIDFTEIIARARLRVDFVLPFGLVPHINMNDREYRGSTVAEVVRGAIISQIREEFLKAVFPHAREQRVPAVSPRPQRGNGA
jgi:hypothetical protein